MQGVGFRPFVFALAERLGLSGHVGNDSHGVFIEVQGPVEAVGRFEQTLVREAPPLAAIDRISASDLPLGDASPFAILPSVSIGEASTPVSPDMATCDDCLRELFDPDDRRFGYPFINCTNCGPRFTILEDIPYDRPLTTMKAFPMCPECQREYDDPTDRRFHAQPNACPACGPQVWLVKNTSNKNDESDFRASARHLPQGTAAIEAAREALATGEIVAVKGLGGFHLACDATCGDALRTLRERKGRVDKPFALMVRDLVAARALAHVNRDEANLLTSRQRPIVLLRRRCDGAVAALTEQVAPGSDFLGVMLPYTPLHHLLVGDLPLVMTSGNLSDEPIARDNLEARERLAGLADRFLLHNRDIHVVCDDSVVRVQETGLLPVRRSRGYAPMPIHLPTTGPATLAVGGELKATFCITKGDYAYLSQHIGDMGNLETLAALRRAVEHFLTLFRVRPERLACDMHPGYLSSQWAAEYAEELGIPLVKVQHHHGHIAALLTEHGADPSQQVIGVSFDGTGYGTDGAIWGGEFLVAGYGAFHRAAHLKYVPLPGGDTSIRRPYRVALAHLWAAGLPWDELLPPVAACQPTEQGVLTRQLERNLNCVPTSSMGRLFDAVAALIGIRQTVNYEAQAAMEMEAICHDSAVESLLDSTEPAGYRFHIEPGEPATVNPTPVLEQIARDMLAGIEKARIAERFHVAVATMTRDVCLSIRDATGLNTVGLSGGVFQNVLLLRLTSRLLREADFEVLVHEKVPPNDGGISLGQAVAASFPDSRQENV